ncbi:CPXV004 protein [Cowpox virus]|uniref:CPXV004 protein n=1 Tax=Cowpox virus TaxID=10243 RepID=U5TDS0_COWPX|nr:CPXV004 protein [Cowpox virus]
MIAVLDDSISLPYNKLEYIFYFYEKLIIVFIYVTIKVSGLN